MRPDTNMVTAIVLLNTARGKVNNLADALVNLNGVSDSTA